MKKDPSLTTDFSGADEYIEDRRVPIFWPTVHKYPFVTDPDAVNIDYTDESWHRSFGGDAPVMEFDFPYLSTQPPKSLSSAENKFELERDSGSKVPEGYIATESGIEPIIDPPFTPGRQHGQVLNPPTEITGDNQVSETKGFYFVARNIQTEAMKSKAGMSHYYFESAEDKRIEWRMPLGYQSPVYPENRFPQSAIKRLPRGR